MPLLRLENISLAFGEAPLFDNINLQIDPKERIFLIGRNGMGKSCLFKVITETLKPDQGKIFKNPGLKIAELSQNLPDNLEISVFDMVAEGLEDIGLLLKRYHQLVLAPPENHHAQWVKELETVQHDLELKNGWQFQQMIENILSKLELPANKKLGELSGGWQRRAALAKALVSQPDVLLLDEPTNHLDIEAIEWLEEYLNNYSGAVLCITHDRAILQKLSKRILELDRGKLISWTKDYNTYLIDKEHRLEVEIKQAKLFDDKLAKEEVWIRQGIKARRTRNEGRVRALEALRIERTKRRELQGKPQFSANELKNSGELIVDAENVSYSIKDHWIIKDFTMRILRGDKIALVGPNGVGKSTLLKLLLGKISPTTGNIKIGTNLKVGYFDQLRSALDPERSAIENVADGRESIVVNGKEKHVISYLSDFLFTPQRVRTPLKNLSGGECNRLLLAKLFSLPTNLLVLDEPTNDLDIETLELLEEILSDYKGTILIVSHDRTFVDEIATSTLHFAGNGKIIEYVGGYSSIPKKRGTNVNLNDNKVTSSSKNIPAKTLTDDKQNNPKSAASRTAKIQKELDAMPNKIATLEAQQLELHTTMNDPEFYSKDKTYINETIKKLEKINQTIDETYKRWEELEKL